MSIVRGEMVNCAPKPVLPPIGVNWFSPVLDVLSNIGGAKGLDDKKVEFAPG